MLYRFWKIKNYQWYLCKIVVIKTWPKYENYMQMEHSVFEIFRSNDMIDQKCVHLYTVQGCRAYNPTPYKRFNSFSGKKSQSCNVSVSVGVSVLCSFDSWQMNLQHKNVTSTVKLEVNVSRWRIIERCQWFIHSWKWWWSIFSLRSGINQIYNIL